MQTNLKLIIKGFQLFEQRIIETTARLSANRSPSITLLASSQVEEADVIIVDGQDADSMQWADFNAKILNGKTVIWVDRVEPITSLKHSLLSRPVLWVNLPITVTRVLEEQALNEVLAQSNIKISNVEVPAETLASILVVDDSQAIRDYLVKTLRHSNYHVVAAQSGEQAIEEAKAQRFDCVLMDVLMPGIDGYKACREIRRIRSKGGAMPVVMLTSKTSPFDKIRGKMAGCNAYLTKPVKIETLLQTVALHAKA